ncbi:MAG TPA: hypothetical protein ENI37_01595 [Chloroflexi bacterium]|nr:hypothetical protein [Chloroflexota bacterium]
MRDKNPKTQDLFPTEQGLVTQMTRMRAWLKRQGNSGRSASFLILLLVASILSGCGGGTRPTTWTGLVVGDGVVYAADLEQVRALDAETGEVLWSFPDEPNLREYGPFYTVALLDEEVLFATSYERTGGGLVARSHGVLRALNIESGRQLWEFAEAGGEFIAAGAVGDNTFIIGNSDGNVYAFHVNDGSPSWSQPFTTGGRVWATPLVVSDTVYISSLDHNLYALELATGQEQWRFEAGGALAGPPLILGDTLYVGAFDSRLYALRRGDGSPVWQFEGENWFWAPPATDGARIYAADVDGNVYALEAESGREIWRRKIDQPIRLSPIPSQDGQTLLVAGDNGTLHGLDPTDGFVLWTQPGEGQLASVVVSGEVAYVSRISAAERIQAFYIDNGRSLWVYPQPGAEE